MTPELAPLLQASASHQQENVWTHIKNELQGTSSPPPGIGTTVRILVLGHPSAVEGQTMSPCPSFDRKGPSKEGDGPAVTVKTVRGAKFGR
ncbi:hypothetical protein AVEN_231320-1 [Araneus ventricosus]|uniref:Uncharacterized protein n=1 Tax=Araneus ventricosus TaxID=182803 RepID=A0A4Y2CIU6_ARAVE|nr:hypothetical protein AVEN_231320-1 [Araneus ventricosus]